MARGPKATTSQQDDTTDLRRVALSSLPEKLPHFSPEVLESHAQAAGVVLEDRGNASGAVLTVEGDFEGTFTLSYRKPTKAAKRAWMDFEEAVEKGACAIAFLVVLEVTEYTVIERSAKGTGIDYWLGCQDDILLEKAARLEVSGIRSGEEARVKARVKEKRRQTNQSEGRLPAYASVTEFGTPRSVLVQA